jgi:NusA N-terminal domain
MQINFAFPFSLHILGTSKKNLARSNFFLLQKSSKLGDFAPHYLSIHTMSMLDLKRIEAAIAQIGTEKKISREKLVDIIEAAIKTAYKKDFGSKDSEVNVKIDFAANTVELAIDKEVVEVVEDPETQIALSDLGDDADGFEIGDVIEIDVTEEFMASDGFGRIASQAARQVIIQKIQETEKEKIYNLFRDKE